MEKPIFYCDCDGVLLNTIEVGFDIMRSMGCNMQDGSEIDYYFKHKVDWNELFRRAKYINNSIDQLNNLKKQNIFKDIYVLTKLSGAYDEERLKREFFKEVLSDIKVVTLQYGLSKGLVVPARGNILLDDEKRYCEEWEKEDGIAILFSKNTTDLDNDIISEINDITKVNKVKRLLKTRNF